LALILVSLPPYLQLGVGHNNIVGISVLQFISFTVVVDRNQLTGLIPTELGRLTLLEDLYLSKFATVSSL
jgi:hypothetical protein